MRLDRPCGNEGWATRHYSGEPPERCSRCGDNGTGARFRWVHIGSGAVVCGPCRLPTHQAAQSRRASPDPAPPAPDTALPDAATTPVKQARQHAMAAALTAAGGDDA